jgi:hypothetical protein
MGKPDAGSSKGIRVVSNSDLILFFALLGGGVCVILWPVHGFDVGASAALAGALFGAAALLLGNWINRYNDSNSAYVELEQRRTKLKTLLAASLVDIAAGLISAKGYVDSALTSLHAGAAMSGREDMTWLTPPKPFSDLLGLELLILDQPAIDSLMTLDSNLSRTATTMADITRSGASLGLLSATKLSNGLSHDMNVLAEVFQDIAPNRQFSFDAKPPELVISILKRLAKPSADGQP